MALSVNRTFDALQEVQVCEYGPRILDELLLASFEGGVSSFSKVTNPCSDLPTPRSIEQFDHPKPLKFRDV